MKDARADLFGLWSVGGTVWSAAMKRVQVYWDLCKPLDHETNWDEE